MTRGTSPAEVPWRLALEGRGGGPRGTESAARASAIGAGPASPPFGLTQTLAASSQASGRPMAALRIVAPAAAISGMIIGGVALGIGSLAAAGGGIAMLVAILVPEIGLAVLAAVFSLGAPPSIPAPGLNLLLVGALLFGCILRLPIDRPHLRLSPSALFLFAFLFYVFAQQSPEMVSGYSSVKGHQVGYYFLQLLTGFGTILAAGYILRGRSPYPVLVMGLAGAVISAGVAVATFEVVVVGPPLRNLVAMADEVGVRAAGPFGNPNYLGTFVAGTLVGTIGLLTATSSRIIKSLLLGIALLCFIALFESQSRGAMVAAFAGIAALLWLRSRPLAVAIMGMGLVAALLIYPAFVEWRLNNLKGSSADPNFAAMARSDGRRLEGSLAGAPLFLAEPVFGVGFMQFAEKSVSIAGRPTAISAHNWYVNVIGEEGSIGAILWLGALAAVVLELRARRGVGRTVGIAVFASLVVGFNFIESPKSYQAAALSLLFLIAALTADWGDLHRRQARSIVSNGP